MATFWLSALCDSLLKITHSTIGAILHRRRTNRLPPCAQMMSTSERQKVCSVLLLNDRTADCITPRVLHFILRATGKQHRSLRRRNTSCEAMALGWKISPSAEYYVKKRGFVNNKCVCDGLAATNMSIFYLAYESCIYKVLYSKPREIFSPKHLFVYTHTGIENMFRSNEILIKYYISSPHVFFFSCILTMDSCKSKAGCLKEYPHHHYHHHHHHHQAWRRGYGGGRGGEGVLPSERCSPLLCVQPSLHGSYRGTARLFNEG